MDFKTVISIAEIVSRTPSAATPSGSARGDQAEGGIKIDHLKRRLGVGLARLDTPIQALFVVCIVC